MRYIKLEPQTSIWGYTNMITVNHEAWNWSRIWTGLADAINYKLRRLCNANFEAPRTAFLAMAVPTQIGGSRICEASSSDPVTEGESGWPRQGLEVLIELFFGQVLSPFFGDVGSLVQWDLTLVCIWWQGRSIGCAWLSCSGGDQLDGVWEVGWLLLSRCSVTVFRAIFRRWQASLEETISLGLFSVLRRDMWKWWRSQRLIGLGGWWLQNWWQVSDFCSDLGLHDLGITILTFLLVSSFSYLIPILWTYKDWVAKRRRR